MLRYLSALNSFGDSGVAGFGASWPAAPSERTASAAAAVAAATFRAMRMRASLSSGHEPPLCPGADAERAASAVADRRHGIHLRDGALSERARLDPRRDEGRPARRVVRRHARARAGRRHLGVATRQRQV